MMSPAQIWSQVEKHDVLGKAGCAPEASAADSLRNLESLECMPTKSDASAVKPGMFNFALNFFAFFAILRSSSLYRIHKYGLLTPSPEIEASPSFLASEPRKSGANSQPRSVFPVASAKTPLHAARVASANLVFATSRRRPRRFPRLSSHERGQDHYCATGWRGPTCFSPHTHTPMSASHAQPFHPPFTRRATSVRRNTRSDETGRAKARGWTAELSAVNAWRTMVETPYTNAAPS